MIDERRGSFLCVLVDGSLEWQTLNVDGYRLKKFHEARQIPDSTPNIITAEQWPNGLLLELKRCSNLCCVPLCGSGKMSHVMSQKFKNKGETAREWGSVNHESDVL